MGMDTNNRTQGIFDSLLALGIIENEEGPVLTGELIEEFSPGEKLRKTTQIKRLLKKVEEWTGKSVFEYDTEGQSSTYKVKKDALSEANYRDFLGVLLSLYPIRKNEYDKSIMELTMLQNRGMIGIVSKIILTIETKEEEKKKLWVKYSGVDGEFKFQPKKLKRAEHWVVAGQIVNAVNHPYELELRKIESIRQA